MALSAVLLASAVVLAAPASPAAACDCSTASDEEVYAAATAVFVGRLVEVDEPVDPQTSSDPKWLTFEVNRVHKGEVAARQIVVTALSPASCGAAVDDSGPFLVVAQPSTRANRWPEDALQVTQCGGTRPLAERPVPASFGAGNAPVPASPSTTATAEAAPESPASMTAAAVEDEASTMTTPALGAVVVAAAVGGTVLLVRRRRPRAPGDDWDGPRSG